MGRSEYGFVIKNIEELKRVLSVIREHNNQDDEDCDLVGEDIDLTGVLNYTGQCVLVATNGGGRDATTQWFENKLSRDMIWYRPFDKPDGWHECQNYIYHLENDEDHKKFLEGNIPDQVISFFK